MNEIRATYILMFYYITRLYFNISKHSISRYQAVVLMLLILGI